MLKSERVYREILISVLNKQGKFTQLDISRKCNISIALVNKILKKLSEMGAVEIRPMQFRVLDISKILFYWAAKRNIQRDIDQKYCINMEIREIEKSLPFILTAYSAWRLLSKNIPFNYGTVYSYVPKQQQKLLNIWLKDKPIIKGKENLFIILTDDEHLIENSKKKIAPIPQIFVDIYSLSGFESKYFVKDILDKYPLFKIEAE